MVWIETVWYQNRKIAWLLLPLSMLFGVLSSTRRWLFKFKVKASYRPNIPVIVVGNITVGGTGKTPTTIALVEYLKSQGFKPGIISRGYGSTVEHYPHLIQPTDTAARVGDEPKLIAERCKIPVVIAPKRVDAAQYITTHTPCNIIISDDGLQHYALQRDIEIILMDGIRGIGNGLLLPAGPLREGIWRLKQADFTLVTQSGITQTAVNHSQFEHTLNTQTYSRVTIKPSTPQPVCIAEISDATFDYTQDYTAVSAIGNPKRFYQSLTEVNINVTEKQTFVDHHPFSEKDFNGIKGQIIMTEKDAVKCRSFANSQYWFLPIQAQFEQVFIDQLTDKLNEVKSKYGI